MERLWTLVRWGLLATLLCSPFGVSAAASAQVDGATSATHEALAALLPVEISGLTLALTWDDGHAAQYHAGGVPDPLYTDGTLETMGGRSVLHLRNGRATYDNTGHAIANPDAGTIVLWFIPQHPMSSPPQDVHTLVDLLTLSPEGRAKDGIHLWWGWGAFQFKAHDDGNEVLSEWYASLWQKGELHSLALTWDSSVGIAAAYADGQRVAIGLFKGVPDLAEKITFGARHAGQQSMEDFALDQVLVFNRRLSDAEIDTLHKAVVERASVLVEEPEEPVEESTIVTFWPQTEYGWPLRFAQRATQAFLMKISTEQMGPLDVLGFQVELDVPSYLELIDPTVARRGSAESWFTPHFNKSGPFRYEKVASDRGDGYVKYILHYGFVDLSNFENYYLIFFDVGETERMSDQIRVVYKSRGGEQARSFPVEIYPAIQARVPETMLFGFDVVYLAQADVTAQEGILNTMRDAGMNIVWGRPRADLPNLRVRSAELMRMAAETGMRTAYWLPWAIPYTPYEPFSPRWLAENPEHEAVLNPEGIRYSDAQGRTVSTTHLAEDDSDYLRRWMEMNLSAALDAGVDMIVHDDEVNSPLDFSFDERSLEAFAEFAGVSGELSMERVLSDYRTEWIEFRVQQNTRINERLAGLVRELAPGMEYYVYSGYTGEHARSRYGIDWALLSPTIDGAIAGVWSSTDVIAATWESVRSTDPTTVFLATESLGDYPGWPGGWPPQPTETFHARTVRNLLAGSQGMYFWWWASNMDGLAWNGLAHTVTFAATFEELLLHGTRTFLPIEDRETGRHVVAALVTDEDTDLLVIVNLSTEAQQGRVLSLPVDEWQRRVIWDYKREMTVGMLPGEYPFRLEPGAVEVFLITTNDGLQEHLVRQS